MALFIALAGFVGAVIGGGLTFVAALVVERRQRHNEQARRVQILAADFLACVGMMADCVAEVRTRRAQDKSEGLDTSRLNAYELQMRRADAELRWLISHTLLWEYVEDVGQKIVELVRRWGEPAEDHEKRRGDVENSVDELTLIVDEFSRLSTRQSARYLAGKRREL